jgi:multiple sugar transport system permease protein
MRARRLVGFGAITVIAYAGAALFLSPLLWMIITSLKDLGSVALFPPQWVPDPVVPQNYVDALTFMPFGRYFANTALFTLAAMVGDTLSAAFVAYGFAKLRAPGRDLLFLFVLSTLMIPFPATMIPQYLLFRQLGWLNSYLPLVVPTYFGSAFNIFLMRQFYMGVPNDLIEAAKIDGCGYLRIFGRILLPLARPALAAVAILSFMYHWNDFLGPLIYLNSQDLYTVSVALANFTAAYGATPWNLLMAASAVAVLPCVVLFFLAQRYFIQGIVITGVKG